MKALMTAIGLAIGTTMAWAPFPQPLPQPKPIAPKKPTGPITPTPTPTPTPAPSSSTIRKRPANTGEVEASRSPHRSTFRTNLGSYALTMFELRYPSGDHKSRQIGVMPLGSQVRATLADNDGREPFIYRAQAVYGWAEGQPRAVSRRDCVGECVLTYADVPGTVFALTGFELSRRGGDDNVREVTIMPEAGSRRIRVVYRDDQKSPRHFDVALRYVLMPADKVHDEYDTSGHKQRRDKDANGLWEWTSDRRVNGKALFQMPRERHLFGTAQVGPLIQENWAFPVLQGFSLKFSNSDHHLGEMSINLGLGPSRKIKVLFNDQNFDDPYDARIRYALIRPSY